MYLSFKLLFDGLYGLSDCKQCFPSRFTKSVLLAEGTLQVSFLISDEMEKQNPLIYIYIYIYICMCLSFYSEKVHNLL